MYGDYLKAGKIAARVRKEAARKICAGMKVIDLIIFVESKIISLGANLAFPCNISINDISSHYSSSFDDSTIFCYGDVVKIDLGVHVNGFIADTAVSVVVEGDNVFDADYVAMPGRFDDSCPIVDEDVFALREDMVNVSNKALDNVLSILRDGVTVSDISRSISDTVKSNNFVPVSNIGGHSIERFKLHAGLSIPNVVKDDSVVLKEGDCIAIEPFVTTGSGVVDSIPSYSIFSYLRPRPFKQDDSVALLDYIRDNFYRFPFSPRHLVPFLGESRVCSALKPLVSARSVFPYPLCRESSGAVVSQCEHTVIITGDSCIVTTL